MGLCEISDFSRFNFNTTNEICTGYYNNSFCFIKKIKIKIITTTTTTTNQFNEESSNHIGSNY